MTNTKNGKAGKTQTNVWLTQEAYQWLRRKSFESGKSQSVIVNTLIDSEMSKEK